MSLERKNQPSPPGITAAPLLSAERDFAVSSSTNFCCELDSGIESPAKTFAIDKQVRIAAKEHELRGSFNASCALRAVSEDARYNGRIPDKIRVDFKRSLFDNRIAEKSTKYRAWYLALTFSSTIFCLSRCSFITRCFARGNAGVTPG